MAAEARASTRARCTSLLLALACACTPPAKQDTAPPSSKPPSQIAHVSRAPTPPDAVVLRIGPRVVSAAEFSHLLGQPPQRRTRQTEPERRQAFLSDLERTELFALEAQRRGVFEQPNVKQSARALLVQHMLDDLFGEHGSQIAPVTDAEVRGYYESHIAEYSAPERVRARHILVRDRAQALALLAQLRATPQELSRFAQLAASSSIDTLTKARAGDLGYFTRKAAAMPTLDVATSASMRPPTIPDAVREAAFALQTPGQLTAAPVKSADGFHIVQLMARMQPTRFALSQVERVIGEQLARERRDAALESFTKRVHADAHVKIDESKLARVRPKLD